MTIGSLFSGIGGLELGLERAGLGSTRWQCEIVPFNRAVLAKGWPDAQRFADIRELDPAALPAVDLVCGGFPCQDISAAGTRVGIQGPRSGLWAEFARVLRGVRPRLVVVENVARLRRAGLDRVLGDLAALGYDAWWDCIPAAAVGAPHERDRIFLVAWQVPDAHGELVRLEPERGLRPARPADAWDAFPGHVGAQLMAYASGERRAGGLRSEPDARGLDASPRSGGVVADRDGGGREGERIEDRQRDDGGAPGDEPHGCDLPQWPPAPDDLLAWGRVPVEAQPAICRMANGPSVRVDRHRRARLRALGNAVVPAVAEVLGRAIVATLEAEKGSAPAGESGGAEVREVATAAR